MECNSTDTAIDGDAQAQITLTKDEVINKSLIFDVTIEPSLEPEGPVPDPLEDWYARIILSGRKRCSSSRRGS